MLKKARTFLKISVLSLLLVVSSGCGSGDANKGQQPAQQSKGPTLITIGTATVGGAWYPMGGGLANVISNYVPNTKANAIPTGSSIENLTSIKNKKMEIGFATSDIPYQMYRGQNMEENKSFKSLANNDYIYLALIVKKDSPINKFTDIKGKKMGTGVPGSSTYVIVEEVLKQHGMTYNDVKPYPSGVAQQASALKDGNLDMFAYVVSGSGGAAPAIVELATTADIKIIGIDEKILAKISQGKPYYLNSQIKAGWVKGVDKPIKALAVGTTICIKADMPDEIVYNICKAMFEHKNELDAIHPQWKRSTKETVAIDLPVPLHPGAEKYYKEIGAPIKYIP